MNAALIPFTCNDVPVRTVVIDDTSRFAMANLCLALGIETTRDASVRLVGEIMVSVQRTPGATRQHMTVTSSPAF